MKIDKGKLRAGTIAIGLGLGGISIAAFGGAGGEGSKGKGDLDDTRHLSDDTKRIDVTARIDHASQVQPWVLICTSVRAGLLLGEFTVSEGREVTRTLEMDEIVDGVEKLTCSVFDDQTGHRIDDATILFSIVE